MKKLITALLIASASALIMTGCSSIPPITGTYTDDDGTVLTINAATNGIVITYTETDANKTDARYFVQPAPSDPITGIHPVVGINVGLASVNPAAYRGWKGACPGTEIDAWFMETLLTSYDHPTTTLYNSQATDTGIIAACSNALPSIVRNGLIILTISGHGSRTRDISGDEADGQDEQLCLWNGKYTDDKVWIQLNRIHTSRPDVRILMISDTCHSGSNYRAGPIHLAPGIRARATDTQVAPNLLHFGGCSDSALSYGSSQGGVFTTALIDAFDTTLTYRQWFCAASALMPKNQRPTMESTGISFADKPIFK